MSVLGDLLSGTPRDWVMAVFAPILTGIELAKGDVWLALAAGGVTVMVWANIAERLTSVDEGCAASAMWPDCWAA